MASYWKSNPRYFCEICKCWLSGDKISKELHERGNSHKEKKERHITELRKRSAQDFQNQQKSGQYLRQMEDGAMKAYKRDLAQQGIILEDALPQTSSSRPSAGLHAYHFVDAPTSKKPPKNKQKDPIKPPKKSFWIKQTSPEGQVYYWNSETGKSQWEKPEGYVEERGNTMESINQQGKPPGDFPNPSKSHWVKQTSPEGESYYWNIETGKSQWEKPKEFSEIKEKGISIDASNDGKPPGNALKDINSTNSSWTEQISPEGHTYYWNSKMEKSQWVKPEGFVPRLNPTHVGDKKGVTPSDESGVVPAKKSRRDPYGSWKVVREPKPKKQTDWQLPKTGPDPSHEGLVDRNALENSFKPEPDTKFKEKIVPSLGGDGGSTTFKKKGAKQRSIRKRNDDD